MSVDLGNFLDNLKHDVNPPGVVIDTNATDDDYLLMLQNAFWELCLEGFDYLKNNYNEANYIITPINTSFPDMPRDLIQLVILWASSSILRNRMLNLKTQYSAKAGPVSIEYQQSAAVFRDVFDDLNRRKIIVLRRLSDVGILPTIVYDALVQQDYGLWNRELFWERA